ncbi:hypothetical protein [Flavobacterium poyangense]|uniref:hypothetical protein n=1 Tax=Flavobacterium poyangense TaxID=2204302 RepID=UPI0014213A62|nr:hypothetical protein [Flavobacterium sp. JXAS1]
MAKVILESWKEGLKKISLTKLQVEKLGLSLREAKSNVDSLLEDEKIILEIDDENLANEFLREAQKIGVDCKLMT